MARHPVVSEATLILTQPAAGPLLLALSNLRQAEEDFYAGRRDLVNSYPMKTRDITRAEIESLYDQHLGNEPWRYRARFNASGSTAKNQSDSTSFYVDEYGETPAGNTSFESYNFFEFNPTRGAAWVDLIVKFGYNNGFSQRGGSRDVFISNRFSSISYTISQGFGIEPIAYKGRGGLSGFEAHMLKLVGDKYEAMVRPALNTYNDRLTDYRNGNGTPTQITFSGNAVTSPWQGYTGSSRVTTDQMSYLLV